MTLPEGARLGETRSRSRLVVGKPAKIHEDATRLSDEAKRLRGLVDDIDAIRTPSWIGGDGQPAYAAAAAVERTKWTTYIALLDTGASALTAYAGALTTAQSRAQDAIDKWEEGETATRNAIADYNESVAAYNAWLSRPPTISAYGSRPVPSFGPAHPGEFVDPGEVLREEAQQILDDARADLDEAGTEALRKLGALPGGRSEGNDDWWGAEGEGELKWEFSWDGWEDAFGKNPSDGRDGKYGDEHDSPFKISIGSVEGNAWVYRAEGEWEDYYFGGNVRAHADGSFTFLGADGRLEGTIDRNGLRFDAEGRLQLVGAEGEAGGEWGYAEGRVNGEASAEVSGEGHLTANLHEGLHAGGELFAGGRARVGAEGDVGGVGGAGSLEGWAGAGIAGDADLSWDDGKLTVGGSGGIAWGLGGKVSLELTLDLPEIADTGSDIIDGIGSLLP